ncbi:IclR family transcriptional regulator [Paraburkholderia tropica]|uniref:IclR family transcriptional regulator n=1 Tax=Paraburkholderia tropica TaxID=92647 RepID=UPI002AB62BDF|nr:IclR family transcriptional regulator [Paraburkholderia tropica]
MSIKATTNAPRADEAPAVKPDADDATPASTSVLSLRLLELLAERGDECSLTSLAEQMGIPKARVHRHLGALRQEGYVTQNPRTSRYRIGWRLFLLGQRLVKQFDAVRLARPVMEELRDQVGQTIVITTFTDNEVVVLDLVRGRSPLEILLNSGTQFLFHSVAQGKIALAFGPPARLEALLAGPLEACTPHTIVDPERLANEIELVRKRGWAEAPGEVFVGVNALAAPIFNADNTLFGALAIVGSIHYLPAHADPATVRLLTAAAARVSEIFGRKS